MPAGMVYLGLLKGLSKQESLEPGFEFRQSGGRGGEWGGGIYFADWQATNSRHESIKLKKRSPKNFKSRLGINELLINPFTTMLSFKNDHDNWEI